MKIYFAAFNMVLLSFLGLVLGVTNNCSSPDSWYVPLIDGVIEKTYASLYDPTPTPVDDSDVEFNLFTRQQPLNATIFTLNNSSAFFDVYKPKPMKFIVSGWRNDKTSYMNTALTKACLKNEDVNVIVVDWSKIAMNINYKYSRNAVESIGNIIAKFLKILCAFDKQTCNANVMYGHSLGAHICGFAGKLFEDGRILRIFGMDPAGPLFDRCNPKARLAKTDATYVGVTHTNYGRYGIDAAIGDADFFLNGGRSQPDCELDPFQFCDHMQVISPMENVLLGGSYPAIACDSVADALNKNCGTVPSSVSMASPTNMNISGIYYVTANDAALYPLGMASKFLTSLNIF